jgi:hypothetical protein
MLGPAVLSSPAAAKCADEPFVSFNSAPERRLPNVTSIFHISTCIPDCEEVQWMRKRERGLEASQPTSQDVLQHQLRRLSQYLPRSAHGSTLITTRDRRVSERFAERDKPIVVLPFEVADATSMLCSRLPNQTGLDSSRSIGIAGEPPKPSLAIAQAASYISEEGVTVARYLESLRPGNADSKALLDQDYYDSTRHADIHNSAFQTWKLLFDQIRQRMPRAAEILFLMCVLNKQSQWLLEQQKTLTK